MGIKIIDLTDYNMHPHDGLQFWTYSEALQFLKAYNKVKSWEIIKEIKPDWWGSSREWNDLYTIRPKD